MRDGLSRRRIWCHPNEFLDAPAKNIRSEWALEDVLGAVSNCIFLWFIATVSGHKDQKRRHPQTCTSTELGDGVFDFEVGKNGSDDDDGGFKGSAQIDRVIHVASDFEMKIRAMRALGARVPRNVVRIR